MTEAVVVAAGVLSYATLAATTYAIGWRRGARRRPPQRVRVELTSARSQPSPIQGSAAGAPASDTTAGSAAIAPEQ